MAGGLTFEQVKKARVFAWHELHYVFVDDSLLRVVMPLAGDAGPDLSDRSPMKVRPSSLRGTEHLLDGGWHHLDTCTCCFCSPQKEQAGNAEGRGRCGRPTT